ncbi:MAG TPA: hypothetical protein VF025_01360 [Gaiellaceae bacterium]
MHVVINQLRLRDPVADTTVKAASEAVQLVVDAGALAARVAKADERHLILILEFHTAEDADRVAREVGGPWMRENIGPLLAGDTERSVGEVIASAEAWRQGRVRERALPQVCGRSYRYSVIEETTLGCAGVPA